MNVDQFQDGLEELIRKAKNADYLRRKSESLEATVADLMSTIRKKDSETLHVEALLENEERSHSDTSRKLMELMDERSRNEAIRQSLEAELKSLRKGLQAMNDDRRAILERLTILDMKASGAEELEILAERYRRERNELREQRTYLRDEMDQLVTDLDKSRGKVASLVATLNEVQAQRDQYRKYEGMLLEEQRKNNSIREAIKAFSDLMAGYEGG